MGASKANFTSDERFDAPPLPALRIDINCFRFGAAVAGGGGSGGGDGIGGGVNDKNDERDKGDICSKYKSQT